MLVSTGVDEGRLGGYVCIHFNKAGGLHVERFDDS